MPRFPREAGLENLHPEFRDLLEALLQVCPWMQPWETFRSFERQDYLFSKGPQVTRAKGGQSAHNFGVAADLVLNPDYVMLPRRLASGKTATQVQIDDPNIRTYPSLWDNSSEATRALWRQFGFHAKDLGLEWGGEWKPIDEHGLGFDLPHVQMPNWKRFKTEK